MLRERDLRAGERERERDLRAGERERERERYCLDASLNSLGPLNPVDLLTDLTKRANSFIPRERLREPAGRVLKETLPCFVLKDTKPMFVGASLKVKKQKN